MAKEIIIDTDRMATLEQQLDAAQINDEDRVRIIFKLPVTPSMLERLARRKTLLAQTHSITFEKDLPIDSALVEIFCNISDPYFEQTNYVILSDEDFSRLPITEKNLFFVYVPNGDILRTGSNRLTRMDLDEQYANVKALFLNKLPGRQSFSFQDIQQGDLKKYHLEGSDLSEYRRPYIRLNDRTVCLPGMDKDTLDRMLETRRLINALKLIYIRLNIGGDIAFKEAAPEVLSSLQRSSRFIAKNRTEIRQLLPRAKRRGLIFKASSAGLVLQAASWFIGPFEYGETLALLSGVMCVSSLAVMYNYLEEIKRARAKSPRTDKETRLIRANQRNLSTMTWALSLFVAMLACEGLLYEFGPISFSWLNLFLWTAGWGIASIYHTDTFDDILHRKTILRCEEDKIDPPSNIRRPLTQKHDAHENVRVTATNDDSASSNLPESPKRRVETSAASILNGFTNDSSVFEPNPKDDLPEDRGIAEDNSDGLQPALSDSDSGLEDTHSDSSSEAVTGKQKDLSLNDKHDALNESHDSRPAMPIVTVSPAKSPTFFAPSIPSPGQIISHPIHDALAEKESGPLLSLKAETSSKTDALLPAPILEGDSNAQHTPSLP